MALARYFYTRFFLHVFFINLSLTFVFNLVEFFEKMLRLNQAHISSILYFILLHLVPSFFENLAIGTWLACAFMIKELQQHNEWETLQILAIRFSYLFRLLLTAGSILAIFSFMGTEYIASPLHKKAETFKQETLKQIHKKTLYNEWFVLSDTAYCHCNTIDMQTGRGTGLMLFQLSPHHILQTVTIGPSFSFNEKNKSIHIPQGATCHTKQQEQQRIQNKYIILPQFFALLKLRTHQQSLMHLIHTLFSSASILTPQVYHQVLFDTLNRILSHLLLILYPLLTFMFFFIARNHSYLRWLFMAIPYPLFISLSTTADMLMKYLHTGTIAFFPYVMMILLAFLLYAKNTKNEGL